MSKIVLYKYERIFLNSKLHKATITSTNINYEGSCLIDISILNAAKILPFEKIDIYNVTNGERLSTYAIPGPADSRERFAQTAHAVIKLIQKTR